MRKRCLNTVYQLAKKNNNVVFIGSDLGMGTLDNFKKEMPDRFFMEGISEGHIVGMAAGLAMSGKTVYFNTIASFITRRCYEQNLIDIGIANANVRLIGNGGGLVYAPLGPTHTSLEDITIMRAIPNMTIIVPSDADEMERAVNASLHHQGPIYFRVAKGGDPIVSRSEHGFNIGQAIVHRNPGKILLIANGIMVDKAIKVSDIFESRGLQVGVINLHTMKPIDEETLITNIEKSEMVITIEEHSIIGGLGSVVAELIAEKCSHKNILFKRIALPDIFLDGYGRQHEMLEKYNCDVADIVKTINDLLQNRRKNERTGLVCNTLT